jgi:hypothetical protein
LEGVNSNALHAQLLTIESHNFQVGRPICNAAAGPSPADESKADVPAIGQLLLDQLTPHNSTAGQFAMAATGPSPAEEGEVPRQEVEGLALAPRIITKVGLHNTKQNTCGSDLLAKSSWLIYATSCCMLRSCSNVASNINRTFMYDASCL